MWLKHIDMTLGFEDVDLLELLRWSVTKAFPCMRTKRGRTVFCIQLVWNIGRALEKFLLVNLSAEGASEGSELRLGCESSPSVRHRCVLPLLGCQGASRMAAHSNALGSAELLIERAELAFLHLNHRRQQIMKEKAIRKAASLKQTMKYKSTGEAPLLMHNQAGKNASERPPKRSRQAASLPKRSSAKEVTGRPAKKPARGRS